MPSFSMIQSSLEYNIEHNEMTPMYVSGPPGVGKTTLAVDVAVNHGIPRDVAQNCIFRPSLHEPTDLLGIPFAVDDPSSESGKTTRWIGAGFLEYINRVAEKYGLCVFTIDELAHGTVMMQNALFGLILDRFLGDFHLHPNVFMYATGNRTKDKAGSNRIVTQGGNRVEWWEMEYTLDDFTAYALDNGIDPRLLAFLRFKPDALFDFDPDRPVNATPRSWEAQSRLDYDSMDRELWFYKSAGRVTEGRAVELKTFYETYLTLPSRESILKDPKNATLPQKIDARYAVGGMVSDMMDRKTIDACATYLYRLESELQVYAWKDACRRDGGLINTKAFTQWSATVGADVLM